MLSPLETAIIKTLCYADVFEFPLTERELHKYLLFSKKTPLLLVRSAVAHLPVVEQKRGYLFLKGRGPIVEQRMKREKVFHKKMIEVERAKKLLRWIPTLRAIFITGSVAMHNASEGDDVDFMIVTKTGWLWTTRLIVALLSFLAGKYRNKYSIHLKDLWCFNLWIDLSRVHVEKTQQNMYTAHETVQATCVLDKGNVEQNFLNQNAWVKKYLPNAVGEDGKDVAPTDRLGAGNPIEHFLYFLQEKHMQKEKTREKTSLHVAFFHPRNTGKMVLGSYEKKLREYLK